MAEPAEPLTHDQRMCQLAIELVSKRVSVKFPAYADFGQKFTALCKEEAYEELDALVEDVSEGYAESVILEGLSEQITIEEKDKEPLCSFIHHTLDHFTPPPTSLHLAKISTKVTQEELNNMRDLVEQQAILLKPDNAKDETLLKLLIMGQKHFFPLLTYLVDLYGRYRLLEYEKLYQQLDQLQNAKKRSKFISKNFNKAMLIPVFFKKCYAMQVLLHNKKTKQDGNSERLLLWYEASMHSFFRRLYGPLKMVPNQMVYKINDSILDYAKYYLTLLVTVHNILKSPDTKLPLQIDFWVIPRAMTSTEDEDDDEDEEESKSEGTSDDSEEEGDDSLHTELNINDLKERLKNVDNLFATEITNKDMPRTTFHRAIEEVIGGARSKRMVMIVDRRIRDEKGSPQDKIENNKNYSERKESDAVEQKGDNDRLYAFLPPNSQDIPKPPYLHESLFNLSRSEVLPSAKKKGADNGNIHVISDLMNLCLLSVQIHEESDVCAYWFINGSGARFYVNDMVNIWPLYFIQKSKDVKTGNITHQDVNPIIDLIEAKSPHLPLQDANFDSFFEINTRKSPAKEGYIKKLQKKPPKSEQ